MLVAAVVDLHLVLLVPMLRQCLEPNLVVSMLFVLDVLTSVEYSTVDVVECQGAHHM